MELNSHTRNNSPKALFANGNKCHLAQIYDLIKEKNNKKVRESSLFGSIFQILNTLNFLYLFMNNFQD